MQERVRGGTSLNLKGCWQHTCCKWYLMKNHLCIDRHWPASIVCAGLPEMGRFVWIQTSVQIETVDAMPKLHASTPRGGATAPAIKGGWSMPTRSIALLCCIGGNGGLRSVPGRGLSPMQLAHCPTLFSCLSFAALQLLLPCCRWTGSGLSCTDINECLTNNGGCHPSATCTNTQGSRTCTCKTG